VIVSLIVFLIVFLGRMGWLDDNGYIVTKSGSDVKNARVNS